MSQSKNNNTSFQASLFLVMALVPMLLLFLSIDSPFYEVWGKIDSSWHFTSGKAWFSGMVPYVDFTDSKGPLLWLIYGLGYSMSHYDYVGVWVMTCVAYVATTYFNYRTVRIFIDNSWLSLTVALLMLAFYFNPLIHDETRSEDFCQPFIALSLWVTCRLLYQSQSLRHFKQGAWLVGISIGATLLLKFTLAMMVFFFALMICVEAKRSGAFGIMGVVWRVISGAVVVCLPFVVAFVIMGNFDDFIREYFVITTKISSHSPRLNIIKWLLGGGFLSWLIIFMSVSTGTMFFVVKRYAWMPIVAFVWFLLITVQNAEWDYYYYSCMIFGIFGLIALGKCFNGRIAACVTTLLVLGVGYMFYCQLLEYPSFKLLDHESSHYFDKKHAEYCRHVEIVGKVNSPRIVFFNCNNVINVADETGGLPGSKYFAKQFGATDSMVEEQYEGIKRNLPHFVYVKNTETESLKKIESLGYVHVLEPGEVFKVYLLALPELKGLKADSRL